MDRGTSYRPFISGASNDETDGWRISSSAVSPTCRRPWRVECINRWSSTCSCLSHTIERVDMSFDTKPIPGTIAVFGANAHIGKPLAKFLHFKAPHVKLRLISSNPAATKNLEQDTQVC